jgi:hypothetical protein
MKVLSKLNEEASAAGMAWFVVILLFSLFLWEGLGVVMDRMAAFQNTFAAGNSFIPVSADRVQVTQQMQLGWSAFILFGILLPIMVYIIIVAKRRIDGAL